MSITSDQTVEALRAAGEATRLRILALLAREELAVLELTRILGQSQPRVQITGIGGQAFAPAARFHVGVARFDRVLDLPRHHRMGLRPRRGLRRKLHLMRARCTRQ